MKIDPKLDLVLERVVDVPLDLVWAAWTKPEHIVNWFAPLPWTTTHCEIDLRPGGKFHFVMRSPEGKDFPNTGCILEVAPNERLVWTDALLPRLPPLGEALLHRHHCAGKAGQGNPLHCHRRSPR